MTTTVHDAEVTALPIAEPKSKRRWAAIGSLSAASFVDKAEDNAISILWPQIYPTLGLSVGQLGPVLGISKLVMTLMQPVWGYAADRFSRKSLLVWFTGIWGLWTLVIGLVDTFPQLVMVRILSSLGLGVFAPAAFSLAADLFEEKTRGRAAGVMESVGVVGVLASFLVLPALAASSPEAWRLGFMVMGGASFVTGLLLAWAIKEPPRGASEAGLSDIITAESAVNYRITLADLQSLFKVRSWRWLLLKDALDAASYGIFTGWAITWFNELGLGDTAFIVLFLIILSGIIGHLLFGWLGDYLEKRASHRGRIVMIFTGLALMLPTFLGFLFIGVNSVPLLVVFGFLYSFGHSATAEGASWPVGQAVLPPELRGSGRAVINMVVGAVGALMLTISGLVADQVGVTTMFLFVIPLPILLSIVVWLPMFRDYSRDHDALSQMILKRREDLLSDSA